MVERSITLTGFHPLQFFSKLGKAEKNATFFTSGVWQIIAWNPSRTIVGKDAAVFATLKKIPNRKSALPFTGGIIGYCSYDLGCTLQGVKSRHRTSLPLAVFHMYDSAILWNGTDVFIVGNKRFERDVQRIHTRPFSQPSLPPIPWKSILTKRAYRKKFTAVSRGIRDGDFYQLNLSYPLCATQDTDGRRLFTALALHHPSPCAAYFEHRDTAIISLSPERFVTIDKGIITTRPIKGTRPRSENSSRDRKLAQELLTSSKEAAELNMITDLLRNDVGKVSSTGTVTVLEHRSLQKTPSVWHTYSVIQGTLVRGLHPVDAFSSMFPGGSITGCPKVAAMREIDRLEDSSRSAYCGAMLMVSQSGFLDSTILIRTIVRLGSKLTLGIGGGVVSDSDWTQEFDETLRKAQPFLTFSSLKKRR